MESGYKRSRKGACYALNDGRCNSSHCSLHMCALDAMRTTRGRDAMVGSQPRRMAANLQVMAAQETARCEVVSPGSRGCFNLHCCIALCLSCVFE